MAYSTRRLPRKRATLSAESMYLLVVLAAAVATAYWAGHSIGIGPNLSGISTVASVLGIDETIDRSHPVGYSDARTEVVAPYCQPGQHPAFSNGMALLHAQIGDAMGAPVECEHAASVVGDTVQLTSAGLAAYDHVTNTESFTDGWRHWELTPSGLITWEGTSGNPPAPNS